MKQRYLIQVVQGELVLSGEATQCAPFLDEVNSCFFHLRVNLILENFYHLKVTFNP